jgi:hypothetical protein
MSTSVAVHEDGSLRITVSGPTAEGPDLTYSYDVPPDQAHDALVELGAECMKPDAEDAADLARQCAQVEELHRRVKRFAADPMRDNDVLDELLVEFGAAQRRLADTLTCIDVAQATAKESL